MNNEEILARIGRDVTDIFGDMFSKRDITIWMTKDFFNRLFPEQFVLQKGSAMITLFGCRIRVVLSTYDGMRWIVGYEGTANERKEN